MNGRANPESVVRFHVGRLEALRRAGHVERIDEDHWRVPNDIVERGQSYDLAQGGNRPQLLPLSTIDLERQVSSDGATWLDREPIGRDPVPVTNLGFGRQVRQALSQRARRLVKMGYAVTKDAKITISRTSIATFERKEIEQVGREMASSLGRRQRASRILAYNCGEPRMEQMVRSSKRLSRAAWPPAFGPGLQRRQGSSVAA
ncbi:DUF3363 domain-containing protein [Bradyrhizobium japonicum]|uniref:DUF3363 domain-containing protein n=1 Tax=Bradyrhizobium japonicum TaxID=375 RepID=UPI0013649CA8